MPATPPANMPRQAAQVQQPPMRGAQKSMGQPPQIAPRQQRAPGRFNPMQGPMGAGMGRARQAAATMFMDRAPQQMQPGMPQQPKSQQQAAMGAPTKQAPKQNQAASQPSFSAGQKAALDLAGMGPMMAMSGQAPGGPVKGAEVVEGMPISSQQPFGDPVTEGMAPAPPEAPLFSKVPINPMLPGQQSITEIEPAEEGVVLVPEEASIPIGDPNAPDVAPALDPAPEDPDSVDKIVEAILEEYGIDPADPAAATVLQALREEFLDLLGSENEGFFTDEELAAQGALIQGQAQQAASNLAQQMAMRGMGASGLAGAGFGDIAAKEFAELTDLAVQNKIAGDETRRANLAALGSMLTGLTADETRKELFESQQGEQRTQQEQQDMWNFINNTLGLTQSDRWDVESIGAILADIESGKSYSEIMKNIKLNEEGSQDGVPVMKAYYYSDEPAGDDVMAGDDVGAEGTGFIEGDIMNYDPNWKESFDSMSDGDKSKTIEELFSSDFAYPPPGFGDLATWSGLGASPATKRQFWESYWEEQGIDWQSYVGGDEEASDDSPAAEEE